MFNFLALLDIRIFGRLYLWLLIGLALFLQSGYFCLAYVVTVKNFDGGNIDTFDEFSEI